MKLGESAGAESTLRRLCDGNRAWVEGTVVDAPGLAPVHDSPLAIAVICSDQIHAPERVLGLRNGDLLVAQGLGPFFGESIARTIQFGVHTLGIRLVIVMTHEGCPLFDPAATGPAATPTSGVGRLALDLARRARSSQQHVARLCAREQTARVLQHIELPGDVILAPAVLWRNGVVELL